MNGHWRKYADRHGSCYRIRYHMKGRVSWQPLSFWADCSHRETAT
jgi:hypothetical protein